MSELEKCLNARVEAGALTKEQAREALRLVRRFEAESLSEPAAIAKAAEELAHAANKARQQTALQILAVARVTEEAAAHPKGIAAGVASIFARDMWGMAGHSNVEARYKAVLGVLHAMFADGLDAYRSKVAGLSRDTIGLQRFVRELYGENTGDATARAAAQAWREATDYAVERFNAAGGDLRHKETWNLPQHWDAVRVKAAGQAAFRDYMLTAFHEGRLTIRDFDTGERVSAERAAEIIDQAWARIESGGLVDLVPGQAGGRKLANSRNQARAFEWTSADAWLDFNRRFGVGDAQIYDLLTGHLDGIARDIAQLEILGPNPQHTARVLIDTARKGGAREYEVHKLEAIWDHVSGAANSPVSEGIATFFRGVRAWLTSAQLGSAALSSVTDFATLRRTAAFNDIPAVRVMRQYLALLNPAHRADRVKAVRLGLIADAWAQRAAGATRHQAEVVGHELPGRIAEFVMRASGLTAHTQAGRWAFGMEYLGHLADLAKTKFDALPAGIRAGFARHGIDAAMWDRIRNGPMYEDAGVRFVWPEALAKTGDRADLEAASRLLELVNTEMDFAIPTPGALERAILIGKNRPGTLSGEFWRASAQYKTFPLTMMTMHLMRGLSSYRGGDRGRYLAAIALSTTVMGAFAMQLKEIAKGRDPRDMTDARFWGAAFMQGGGAGILGDFLYAGLSRADRSFYMTAIGGPTAGLVDDLARLTGANIAQTAEGRDSNFGAELARFVRMNTPGSSLWYARLAMDRLLWDRLQEMADPHYAARFARMETRALTEYGQEFWWRPGEAAPRRAPDLLATAPVR